MPSTLQEFLDRAEEECDGTGKKKQKRKRKGKVDGKVDESLKNKTKASIWVMGKEVYSGKITDYYGDGFRFKDGNKEIEVEMK